DAVPAVEVLLDVEEVHRAALAARAAVDLAEEFGHARVGGHAAGEAEAVVAVGGDERVPVVERPDGAGRDGLLAYVEVEEAGDLLAAVHLRGALLEAALEQHVAVHRVEVVRAEAKRLVRVAALGVEAKVRALGEALRGGVRGERRGVLLRVGLRLGASVGAVLGLRGTLARGLLRFVRHREILLRWGRDRAARNIRPSAGGEADFTIRA